MIIQIDNSYLYLNFLKRNFWRPMLATGGLFLSRREVFKQEDGKLMTEKDLWVGRHLHVLKHVFLILGSSDSTLRWMEDKNLPFSDIYRIISKLRFRLFEDAQSGKMADDLRAFETPEGGNGCVTKEGFTEYLRGLDMVSPDGEYYDDKLCEHEIITLQRGAGNKNPAFDYEALIREIIEPTNYYN